MIRDALALYVINVCCAGVHGTVARLGGWLLVLA